MSIWTQVKETGNFVTEASDLQANPLLRICPNCKKPVGKRKRDFTSYVEHRDEEHEVTHWEVIHPCGAHLIIFND